MQKDKKMEKLNKEIRDCKNCSLWRTRRNTVPGEGPANAKIIIIGQAPGREEDLQGLPFVGKAGKFLSQLLEIAGIKREKVFITSLIKCFPPSNRKPTKKEIKTCSSWLEKQIKIIEPKRFILLGEVAFSVFFPKEKLKDFRGKWIKKDDKEYFITYHPAAGLRFPRIKKNLEKDFKKIKNLRDF